MTLKSDAKFEEKLTLGSKNDIRNLVNFNASRGKSENLHFVVLLLLEVYCLSQKNAQELCIITLKNYAKFEGELTCTLKNDMRNLVNFTGTLKNLKICTLRDFFVQGNIKFELKITEELCVMTLKGYTIF